MDVSKEGLAEVVERLKQERDELRVKVHLGSMEAKEQWEALERKWETFEGRIAQAKRETTEKVQDANDAAGIIANELEAAYQRIRENLRAK